MIRSDSPLKGLPLAVVDCEATGLPPDGRVVEVAVVHLDLTPESVPRVAMTARVNPGCPISEKAFEKHGITDADVADAPTWAGVLPAVMDACAGRVVTAYNVPADWRFMVASGGSPATWDAWLDLHVVAQWLNRYEHSLGQVAARYGIALDAHGATGDAVTTALVARPLLREWWADWHAHDGTTLAEVLAWQHEAARVAEADFCEWLRNKGARGNRPDCAWHELLGAPLPAWPEPPAPTWRVEKDGRVVPAEPAEVSP